MKQEEKNDVEKAEEIERDPQRTFAGIKSSSLYGQPDIPSSLYRCPEHGEMLAAEVAWDRKGNARCPKCEALLEPVSK